MKKETANEKFIEYFDGSRGGIEQKNWVKYYKQFIIALEEGASPKINSMGVKLGFLEKSDIEKDAPPEKETVKVPDFPQYSPLKKIDFFDVEKIKSEDKELIESQLLGLLDGARTAGFWDHCIDYLYFSKKLGITDSSKNHSYLKFIFMDKLVDGPDELTFRINWWIELFRACVKTGLMSKKEFSELKKERHDVILKNLRSDYYSIEKIALDNLEEAYLNSNWKEWLKILEASVDVGFIPIKKPKNIDI